MTKCSKFINETMGNIKSQLKEAIKSRILIGLVPPLNRFFFFLSLFFFFFLKACGARTGTEELLMFHFSVFSVTMRRHNSSTAWTNLSSFIDLIYFSRKKMFEGVFFLFLFF